LLLVGPAGELLRLEVMLARRPGLVPERDGMGREVREAAVLAARAIEVDNVHGAIALVSPGPGRIRRRPLAPGPAPRRVGLFVTGRGSGRLRPVGRRGPIGRPARHVSLVDNQ